jgi:hypothetical protein|tara:strand:+ start:3702 stop:4166 length:465 start_codon:yes stop_codon:yes gene_type:complete
MDNRIMTEELNNSDTGEKNWKEMREKLNLYETKIAEYEGKERHEVFNKAGLDTTKGVGKAVEMMYEGDMTVEGIQQYASNEFGVEFGNQDRLQDTVQATEQSQDRLNNIQKNSVVDLYNEDVISQVREVEKSGNIRNSISAKLSVIEEAKKNSK